MQERRVTQTYIKVQNMTLAVIKTGFFFRKRINEIKKSNELHMDSGII